MCNAFLLIHCLTSVPGGPGFDGGHLYANDTGGGAEDINVVAMHSHVNRAGGAYHQWEDDMRHILNQKTPPDIQGRGKPWLTLVRTL